MRKVAVGLVLALACGLRGISEEPKGSGEPRCEIKLTNGSLIKGTFKGLTGLTLKTRHGSLKFALKDLRGVVWGNVKKEELDTVTATDGVFKGWVEDVGPLDVDTGYGFLKIPTEAIKTLRVSISSRTLGDSFDSDDLADWTKFGPSPWSVVDGKLTEQPSGNYDSIQYNEVLDGAYTVEVDITNANNAGILFNAQDQNNASGVWLNPNNVRVMSGGTWYNNQTANWGFNYAWNGTVHVKLEIDGGHVTIFIGEKKVGETNVGSSSGRIGLFSWNAGTTFDNVVITR